MLRFSCIGQSDLRGPFMMKQHPRKQLSTKLKPHGHSYFPLVFSHDRKIIQLRATDSGNELVRIGDSQKRTGAQELGSALAPYNDVLLVDVQLRTFRDLRTCLNKVNSCPFADGETAKQLVKTGHWTEIKVERSFGLYDTQIKLFKRVNQNLAPVGRNQ